MIAFPCPKCQATLKAPEEKGGARTKCPRCGCPVQVPGRLAPIPPVITEVVPVEAPIAAATHEWHYSRGGQKFGPLAEDEVYRAIGRGELRSQDEVWRAGMSEWEPASRHFTFPQAPRVAPVRVPVEAPEYECPFCGCGSPPNVIQRTSSTGWVVFWTLLILGLFCFIIGCLLCFIGLMMKESVRVCPVCGNTITGNRPYESKRRRR